MVRPSRLPPSLLPWLLLFLPLLTAQHRTARSTSNSAGQTCPCDREDAQPFKDKLFISDTRNAGMKGTVYCCPEPTVGVKIAWSFKGKTYPWEESHSSLRPHPYCGEYTMESRGVRFSDQGNYTCTITYPDGTTITRTTQFQVYEDTKYRDRPAANMSSGDLTKPLGSENVTFTCEAYLGDSTGSMMSPVSWVMYFSNGSMQFANLIPNVTVLPTDGERGKLRSRLVIAKVADVHYGTYQCRIGNLHGVQPFNMSLIQGVPASEARRERYRSLVGVAAAAVAMVGVAVFVWFRCGLQISLCLRHAICAKVSESGQVDVLVVHGYSSTRWVWGVLLPMLEDTCHYTCFLPQRDMLAGDLVADSILKVLRRCRRVLVVVTPCLLDSPWAAWSAYSGIQAALTSPARILSLILKEPEVKIGTHEKNSLLEVLRVVRRVQVPPECGWHIVAEHQQQDYFTCDSHVITVKITEEDKQNEDDADETLRSGPMLNIPELTQPSESHSPGSQRLSNMVSGSNAASRESLRQDKKDTEDCNEPINQGFEDPGSPCSETPFFCTDSDTSQKDRHSSAQFSVCEPLGRCMKMVCVGDPEQVFWQTVRLHLGPPSLPLNHQRKTPWDVIECHG